MTKMCAGIGLLAVAVNQQGENRGNDPDAN